MAFLPLDHETFWKLLFCLDELEHPVYGSEDRTSLLVSEAGQHDGTRPIASQMTQTLLADLAGMFTACSNTTLTRLQCEKTPYGAADLLACAMQEALNRQPCPFEAASRVFQDQDECVRLFAGFLANEVSQVACYSFGNTSRVECIQFPPSSWRSRIRRSLLMERANRLYGSSEDPKLQAHMLVARSLCKLDTDWEEDVQ